MTAGLPRPVSDFFDAVNALDFAALKHCLAEDITYQLLVPHPAVAGREAVIDALRTSLAAADRIHWELMSHLGSDGLAFVERVDRFWFGDNEAAVEVVGVFEVEGDRITAVRDYTDLSTWRRRKAAALQTGHNPDEGEP